MDVRLPTREPLTRGDLVRHPEYPQWGLGYVIRAKKASADVFFHWGGKRTLPGGEPLAASRAAGIEAQLVELCAGLSPHSWSRGRHSVYAIELDRAVYTTARQSPPATWLNVPSATRFTSRSVSRR